MRRLIGLLFWWFAIVGPGGEVVFFTYPVEQDCKIVHRAYARQGFRMSDCTEMSGRPGSAPLVVPPPLYGS